jgi:hypothetical protein
LILLPLSEKSDLRVVYGVLREFIALACKIEVIGVKCQIISTQGLRVPAENLDSRSMSAGAEARGAEKWVGFWVW